MHVDRRDKEYSEYVCPIEEYERILERFPEGKSNFYLSLITPYCIGTRISETFAIDLYDEVDFENHTVTINNQFLKMIRTCFL